MQQPMVENIREFLERFPRDELVKRGILRGQTYILQGTSIDPLVGLMQEHGLRKLELPERNWYLDVDFNFNNPEAWEQPTNVKQLSQPGNVFNMQNVHINPYYRSGVGDDDESGGGVPEGPRATFQLERDLQAHLRGRVEDIESGLRVVDGGSERTVASGRIDITAEDRNGELVVIELKAGRAQPDSLTQLLAYMAALGQEEGRSVRGILVAADFHQRVVLAASLISDVLLQRYSVHFSFGTP